MPNGRLIPKVFIQWVRLVCSTKHKVQTLVFLQTKLLEKLMIVDEKRACVCGLNVTAIHLIVVETLRSNVNPMVVPEKNSTDQQSHWDTSFGSHGRPRCDANLLSRCWDNKVDLTCWGHHISAVFNGNLSDKTRHFTERQKYQPPHQWHLRIIQGHLASTLETLLANLSSSYRGIPVRTKVLNQPTNAVIDGC